MKKLLRSANAFWKTCACCPESRRLVWSTGFHSADPRECRPCFLSEPMASPAGSKTPTNPSPRPTTPPPDYFQVMGIPVRQGRSFNEQDTTNAPLVVVVDEQVARRAWPGESP